MFGDPPKGREHVVTVDVLPKTLKAGNNLFSVTTVSGSWVLWDAVRFEAPRDMALTEASSVIYAVEARPALVRRGQSLFQPATVKVLHVGPAAEASLHVDGSTSQPVSLEPGCQVIKTLLSPVTSSTTVTFQLRSGDQVVDERPLQRKSVRKWEIHLIHQTHLDVGYLYTLGRVTGEGYSRITAPVTISIEDAGPVVGTIKIESTAPGCTKLVRRVRIYDGLDRVDLINDLDKSQELEPESVYFAFPLLIPDGQPILKPALHVEGDGVVVTSLKPSRDSKALMVRMFAASGKTERLTLKCTEPKHVYLSSPQESRGRQIEGPIDLPAYGIVTLRLEPK